MTSPEKSQATRPKPGLATLVIHHSITVLILILFLGLGTWGYLTYRNTDFFATVDRAEFQAQLRPPLVEAQRQRISFAIEAFTLLHERPPARLDELVDSGLLLSSDLFYPKNQPLWEYERLGEGYRLDEITSKEKIGVDAQGEEEQNVHN